MPGVLVRASTGLIVAEPCDNTPTADGWAQQIAGTTKSGVIVSSEAAHSGSNAWDFQLGPDWAPGAYISVAKTVTIPVGGHPVIRCFRGLSNVKGAVYDDFLGSSLNQFGPRWSGGGGALAGGIYTVGSGTTYTPIASTSQVRPDQSNAGKIRLAARFRWTTGSSDQWNMSYPSGDSIGFQVYSSYQRWFTRSDVGYLAAVPDANFHLWEMEWDAYLAPEDSKFWLDGVLQVSGVGLSPNDSDGYHVWFQGDINIFYVDWLAVSFPAAYMCSLDLGSQNLFNNDLVSDYSSGLPTSNSFFDETNGWQAVSVTGAQTLRMKVLNNSSYTMTLPTHIFWDDLMIMYDKTVVINGLLGGQKVELYSSGGLLLFSGTCSATGNPVNLITDITPNITSAYGLLSYFKVYDTNGTTLLYTSPTTGVWGGDIFTWVPNGAAMAVSAVPSQIFDSVSGLTPNTTQVTATLTSGNPIAKITRVPGQTARGAVTAGTTVGATLPNAPTNGNSLLAVFGGHNSAGAVLAVSGIASAGATWSKLKAGTDGASVNTEVWLASNVQGAGALITVTFAGGTIAEAILDVFEYNGVLNASVANVLDQSATNTGSSVGSGVTGTTPATSQDVELEMGAIMAASGTGGTQSTPTNGFTLIDGTQTNHGSLACLELITNQVNPASSGTTFSATLTYAACIVTLKANPSGVPAGQPLAGRTVAFTPNLGTCNPTSGTTDANGQVTATFSAGANPGLGGVYANFAGDSTYGSAAAQQFIDVYLTQPIIDPTKGYQVFIEGQEILETTGHYILSANFQPQAFEVDTPLMTYAIGGWWLIQIYRYGVLEFTGRILGRKRKSGTAPGTVITGVDNKILMQRRIVNAIYTDDPKNIITTMLSTYPCGVTPGILASYGNTIPLNAGYELLFDALTQIQTLTGWLFRLHVNATLDFASSFGGAPNVPVILGQNATLSEYDEDWSQLDTSVTAVGSGTGTSLLTAQVSNAASSLLYGVIESLTLQKNITDPGALALAAQQILNQQSQTRLTIMVDFTDVNPTGAYGPWDTIPVTDPDTSLSGFYQIYSIKRNLANADYAELVLTNAIISLADIMALVRANVKDLSL